MSRCFIGRLPREATNEEISKFFGEFGELSDVHLKEGFGFVEFRNEADAQDACAKGPDRDFMGQRLVIEIAKARRPREERDGDRGGYGGDRGGYGGDRGGDRGGYGGDRGGYGGDRGGGRDRSPPRRSFGRARSTQYRITVENLPAGTSWQDLKDFFRKSFEVTYSEVSRDRDNEGLVDFACKEDLDAAMDKFDGADFNGNKIKLTQDKSRLESGGGGGYGGRDRSPAGYGGRGRSRSPGGYGGRGGGGDRGGYGGRDRSPPPRRSSPPPRRDSRSPRRESHW
eukprot:Partr_v1_DN24307_c0_g2_i1_m31807 putative serine arginine-rich splicing factor